MENLEFQGNILIKGKIVCDTGLHIGESNETLEIGGIDNMVMRDKKSNLPYIPGSSLKGKLRHLLELFNKESVTYILNHPNGRNKEYSPCNCGKCIVCKIFGFTNDDDDTYVGPTRIIIRDAFPDENTIKFWDKSEGVSRGAELKTENVIDRVKSTAMHPRPTERIPKDSKFDFEMVFGIYTNEDKENFKEIFTAFKLIESNYLGGNGSRGYGQIHFEELSYNIRNLSFYTENTQEKIVEIGKLSELNDEKLKIDL